MESRPYPLLTESECVLGVIDMKSTDNNQNQITLPTLQASEVFAHLSESVQKLLIWSTEMPLFNQICLTDRKALLKKNVWSLLTARLAFRSMAFEPYGQVRFDTGTIISEDQCADIWKPWISAVLTLSRYFRLYLNLDQQIYQYLLGAILLNDDNGELELSSNTYCEAVHDSYTKQMEDYCVQSRSPSFVGKIVAALSDIETIATLGEKTMHDN